MKKIILICLLLIVSIFLVNYVSAEILVSETGVEYDSKILDQFQNQTFVPIIIELNEFSDEGARNLLSNFNEEEVEYIVIHNITQRVSVDLTEETFFKLIQNDRINKIYYNAPIYFTSKKQNIVNKILILMILFIIILTLYLKNKKRGKK